MFNSTRIKPLAAACMLAFAPVLSQAADDAEALLRQADRAMGAAQVKTLRFAGSGTGATFGQAYKPGTAWPKLNYSSFVRVADYENAALREDFARSRAEPNGGLRSAVAEGATLVVSADAKPYYEKVFANPNRISPDSMAKSGKKPKVIAFGTGKQAKKVFTDGSRSFEIHSIADSVHAEGFNLVYLPKEKLVIEADAYTPLPPNAPPPTPVNGNNVNLAQNIERLKLDVERILPLHGRVVPMAELNRTIGRK